MKPFILFCLFWGSPLTALADVDLNTFVGQVPLPSPVAAALKVTATIGRSRQPLVNTAFEVSTILHYQVKFEDFHGVSGDQKIRPWQWPGALKSLVNVLKEMKTTTSPSLNIGTIRTLYRLVDHECDQYEITGPIGCATLIHDHYAVPGDSFRRWLVTRELPDYGTELTSDERTRLSSAVGTLREYLDATLPMAPRPDDPWDQPVKQFRIPIGAPQFIHRELVFLVSKDAHDVLVIDYNFGRLDD